ncbi:glycoside hydrolase family 95 protein [Inquilinus sp. KBS0705]|nr:glycoside hydrolase family 95 protein [Inquilinus sp. KBS0705]
MKIRYVCCFLVATFANAIAFAQETSIPTNIDQHSFDPSAMIWLGTPATKWNDAIPVGNGRLGGMIFGGVTQEHIQLNEDTYWTGGPYSSVVKGGFKYLPEVQDLVFKGKMQEAQALFGRKLMGYPVEQQKYQSLADLMLFFKPMDNVSGYKRWLDLEAGVAGVQFTSNGVTYKREIFSSVPNQVIALRLTASKPGSITFKASLRGVRNQQHSDYATDYFRMDGIDDNGLILTGKSADYLGVEGKLRYEAQLKAIPEGGTMKRNNAELVIDNADAVTLYFTAATNFVNYKDVSADQHQRVESYLNGINGKTYQTIKSDAVADYQKLYKRVSLHLPATANAWLPTDKRLANALTVPDPQLAALAYQFGRYVLISSSRPGTQPANLQGIWNNDMNPWWDSKYTTNINTQMNYWPVESANLSECAEPLIQLIRDVTDQGTQLAKENYNSRGWVLHQNTDLWRVAAPMDGPTWGTFTTGGAWLCDELWEHYLYTGDKQYLKDIYPVIKGSVDFFMDFLVMDPKGKWLVTNPSMSPENFTGNPGNGPYFDETTGSMIPGTTICAGSSIDMQIITNLFTNYLNAAKVLNKDADYAKKVSAAKSKLRPQLIGANGELQEWTEDWPQLEKQHRHVSPLYGLYPGNVFSVKNTPQFIEPIKAVLNQRGDNSAKGWTRAWKIALWARLRDGDRANAILKGYFTEAWPQLFTGGGGTVMQVDGTLGVTAAINELLVQSNNGVIDLLPALPGEWTEGEFNGVCTAGAFELDIKWQQSKITAVKVLSKQGQLCHINTGGKPVITYNGKKIKYSTQQDGSLQFETQKGGVYVLTM